MKLSSDYDEVADRIRRFGEAGSWSAEEFVRDEVKSPSILRRLYTDNLLGRASYHIRCGVMANKNTPLELIEIAALRDESPAVRDAAKIALIVRFKKDMGIRN